MHRLLALGLAVLLLLGAACDSDGATSTSTPTVSAPTATPSATVEATPEATEPPPRRQWIPRGYAAGTYNRVVPPDIAAAIAEGDKYGSPRLPSQLEVAPSGGECVAAGAAAFRASDWLFDLGRFEEDGTLILTPTYAEEITDHVLLRARHIDSGAEHLYEARRHALYEFERELASGELRRYEARPEFSLAGEWLLVVTHGPNWGCVTLDVPEQVSRPFVYDVADARWAGLAFPKREGWPDRVHPMFYNPPPLGTDERECVAVPHDITHDDGRGIRSGDWVVTGWFSNVARWNPTQIGKLPMAPYWQDEMLPPTIRLALDGEPALTMIYQESPGYAFSPGTGDPVGWRFFPNNLMFPEEGTWLMVVESDPNWGCYLVDLVVGGLNRSGGPP